MTGQTQVDHKRLREVVLCADMGGKVAEMMVDTATLDVPHIALAVWPSPSSLEPHLARERGFEAVK